ncbi:MAG: hypothetical protein HFG34_08770 [Eubacterium sp.]|nr:hypothetical protein [Eubacterium sp.]
MKKIRIVVAAVFMMMGIIFPSFISSAATVGETVGQNTEAALKAVDYYKDEKIASLLAPTRYTMADKLNKKLEISKRDGRNIADITDEEAILELNLDNVKVVSYGEVFEKVQGEIGQIIQRIVDSTAGAQDQGAAFYTEKILQNKEKLLLGLSYLERLYNFDMGEKNIRDVLLYEPGTYGISVNVLDWLIKIGGSGGDTLKISNCNKVFGYNKLFWSVTASANLGAFLEQNRQKWIPDTTLDEWLLQESHAYIVDDSTSESAAGAGLYSRMYADTLLQSHILPLLNVSEDSIYVIANSATITYGIVDCYVDRNLKSSDPAQYAVKREEFRQDLEQSARQQKAFIDLWHRITKPENRGLLTSNRLVLDSLRIYADNTTSAQTEWSAKFGDAASCGVREFFTPLDLYDNFMFSDGMAAGTGVRYYLSKALSERGLATYAHELTHLLVSPVMLNQYGIRDGMQAEVYTRGMFEPYEVNDPPAFNLNLIYGRQDYNERFHNAVPERFQNEKDLQSYMSGLLDVVYTLDYAEADIMFSKTPEEKKKWFHKLEQIEDTKTRSNQGDAGSKHCLDSVRELSLEEAKELNTIDDLIQDSIIVSRYEVNGTQTTGTMASNGYYVVPLFSANYAGVQNDIGVSGDVMIRRQAFELLAEYGYYEGMVPYISNQYKAAAQSDQTILSDTYILRNIFGSTYGTMADFKKAMFQKRIDKVKELKPVTIQWKNQTVTIRNFESLKQLMKEAVEYDLINVNVTSGGFNNIRAQATQVEQLKAQIFRAYLLQTKDFQEPIYGDGKEPVEPTATPEVKPTAAPTATPEVKPTAVPTATPTLTPEVKPTAVPTETPGAKPDVTPGATEKPGVTPDVKPTAVPTETPGAKPDVTPGATEKPGVTPDVKPTAAPTETPGAKPDVTPGATEKPGVTPEVKPTTTPSDKPSVQPPADTDPGMSDKDDLLPEEDDDSILDEGALKSELLIAKVSASKKSQVIRWNSVKSADGYYIYGAKANGKYKCLRTVSKKVLRWKRTGLKKGTQYRYYVMAYKVIDGKRVSLSKSLPAYSTTKGGKYGNPVKLQTKRSLVSVKAGKKMKLTVKAAGKKMNKASKKVRYISANPSIAKVSKKGIVTGGRRGTCYIYCVAWNGLSKKIKVRVI